MILLFDVGNSRFKWRTLQHGRLLPGGQHYHQALPVKALLDDIWGPLQPPTAVWGISVAAASLAEHLSHWSRVHWGFEPRFITTAAQMGGVTNGYTEPGALGADRWMALVGAAQLFQGGCCVADCGTAVTVDCLNMNHDHVGGVIIPGLTMMPRCVTENTARVELGSGNAAILGRDTATCLTSGALHAIAGTLERIAVHMESHESVSMKRIVTGGDAEQILPWLDKGWHYEPDLIFIGLASAIKEIEGNE